MGDQVVSLRQHLGYLIGDRGILKGNGVFLGGSGFVFRQDIQKGELHRSFVCFRCRFFIRCLLCGLIRSGGFVRDFFLSFLSGNVFFGDFLILGRRFGLGLCISRLLRFGFRRAGLLCRRLFIRNQSQKFCQFGVIFFLGQELFRFLRSILHHNRGRDDGGVIDAVALHIVDQCLSHLGRVLPAILGIGGAGLQDDLRHFIVGIHGRRQILRRSTAIKRQLTIVVYLIQRQTQSVNIDGVVQGGHGIGDLRGGIAAAVFFRQGSVFQ